MPLGTGIFLTHVSALSNYQLPVIWTLFLSNCSGDSLKRLHQEQQRMAGQRHEPFGWQTVLQALELPGREHANEKHHWKLKEVLCFFFFFFFLPLYTLPTPAYLLTLTDALYSTNSASDSLKQMIYPQTWAVTPTAIWHEEPGRAQLDCHQW